MIQRNVVSSCVALSFNSSFDVEDVIFPFCSSFFPYQQSSPSDIIMDNLQRQICVWGASHPLKFCTAASFTAGKGSSEGAASDRVQLMVFIKVVLLTWHQKMHKNGRISQKQAVFTFYTEADLIQSYVWFQVSWQIEVWKLSACNDPVLPAGSAVWSHKCHKLKTVTKS